LLNFATPRKTVCEKLTKKRGILWKGGTTLCCQRAMKAPPEDAEDEEEEE
jgi:hypothetical protein